MTIALSASWAYLLKSGQMRRMIGVCVCTELFTDPKKNLIEFGLNMTHYDFLFGGY